MTEHPETQEQTMGKSSTPEQAPVETPAEQTPDEQVTTVAEVVPGDSADTLDGTERAGELVEPAPEVDPDELGTVEVELLHHWTTADGEAQAPGARIKVDTDVADQLLSSGYAQTLGAGPSEGSEPEDAPQE